jgi:hypothetical protein
MAFALIRARNLKISDLGSTDRHNSRRYESPDEWPPNINPKRADENTNFYQTGSSLKEAWNARTEGVTGARSDSNVGIEYVLGINDKSAWMNYSSSGYFMNAKEWLEKRHGKGSVIAFSFHQDESNPHAHFVIVPVVKKEVKWKNRRGEGVKIEKRIDTRSYTGGRLKLRQLQDDYFVFAKGFEEKLRVKIYRGKLVEHQTKDYIKKTDHQIGEMRNQLHSMSDGIEKMKLSLEIEEKRKKIEESKLKLKEISRNKDSQDDKWKEKGIKDNPVIFHTEKEHKIAEKKEHKEAEKKKWNKGWSM